MPLFVCLLDRILCRHNLHPPPPPRVDAVNFCVSWPKGDGDDGPSPLQRDWGLKRCPWVPQSCTSMGHS